MLLKLVFYASVLGTQKARSMHSASTLPNIKQLVRWFFIADSAAAHQVAARAFGG